MRIYLADLGHNQVTLSSDIYPLGVANLATYAREYARLPEALEIRLFREPQDLKAALEASTPDVLGLSSYSWNHDLSLHFARHAQARAPKVLTVMGGPNFPLTRGEQESFLRGMPEIDVAVRGPTYEGERAFLNFVQRYADAGKTLPGLQEEPLAGSLWIDRRTGDFVQGGEVERIRNLDEIPSPYLAGLLDPYFETGYFPMMQIARGCPFSCAFCNSSVKSNSKIYSHSLENVKADLLYVAQHVKSETPLCFADDNFGMYELDEEVADYIAYLQDQYNWPHYIRTTTGKNKHERIIRVMRKTRGVLPMTTAVQSLNPVVLKNIERSNIKLEAYSEIQKELQSQGLQAYGELILCLPGETKQSFMKAVEDLIDSGAKRISAHQLMLIHGAPLANPESRAQWGFNTRFRVVARNIGNYTGEPVAEVEEIVVETPTFSFTDYLEARIFHLLVTIYYYEGNFEEAFEFAHQSGLKPYDLIVKLQSLLDQAPAGIKQLIREFLQESHEELFMTKEDCLEWSRRHFGQLVEGHLGGNLLSKYSMTGRFFVTQDTLDFLEMGIRAGLGLTLDDVPDDPLGAVIDYLRVVLLHSPFSQTLNQAPHWTTSYDVEAWRGDKYSRPLADYFHAAPLTLATFINPEHRVRIERRLATFGEHPTGMGKFTRTMFAQDLRRAVVPLVAAQFPEAEGGVSV